VPTMRRRGKSGLTLAELTLGMAVTVVIGGAVATLASALSSAHAATEAFHESLQTGRMSLRRVQAMVRRSKLILAVSSNAAVLWDGDANEDGKINPSEVVLLDYDAQARELREVARAYPADLSAGLRDALEGPWTLDELLNTGSVTLRLTNDTYTTQHVLAEDVRAASFSADPKAPLARVLYIELRIGEGDSEVFLRSAAAPRAPVTERVKATGDGYVLE